MQPIHRSHSAPLPPAPSARAPVAPAEQGPRLAGDTLSSSASTPTEAWHLSGEVTEAGPEIRRHIALNLSADPQLASLERRFAAGQLDEASYRALRAPRVERATRDALAAYHAAAARQEGVSATYFQVRHHGELMRMYHQELGDLDHKLLEDVRWQVVGRYHELCAQDPTLGALQAQRERRVARLPAGAEADRDVKVGKLNGRIHRRENDLRLQAQRAWLGGLDGHLELDAVTRRDLRAFVAHTHAGTMGSGLWKGPLAQVISGVSHRPGELDASHAFIGVADGLFYESVTSPPPDKAAGVKPTTATELFAMFDGRVRTQEVPGGMTPEQARALYAFAIDKQGLPYNVWGLIGGTPGVGKTLDQDASYYCAEFVGRALNAAGLDVWTKAGNTQVDKANFESVWGAMERSLPQGLSLPLRAARALPYTVARSVAPRLAERMGAYGLTPDDLVGTPRLSPQKLINGKIEGKVLETTFDRTR